MSSARQCDLCEALFPDGEGASFEYTVWRKKKTKEGEEVVGKTYMGLDLCPKCAKGFLEYVQHEEST